MRMKSIQVAAIIHCNFEYECPLDWDMLYKTSDPMVNFCDQCNKEVILCLSDDEIDHAWESGICIAHPIYDKEMFDKIKAYEEGTGGWPFQALKMPMGLPRRK